MSGGGPARGGAGILPAVASSPAWLLELFVAVNLGFLVVDIAVAHSVNRFADPWEWVPLVFAGLAALVLAVGLLRGRAPGPGERVGLTVGVLAILVGVGGLVLHLESQFFQYRTLRSLVYSAPFAAPLAFAGLGFLLLLNRMVPRESVAWGRWVAFMALGGFAGNFALTLADHAQNGFFHPVEWVSVATAGLAWSTFLLVVVGWTEGVFLRFVVGVLGLQVAVGLLGFVLHVRPLTEPSGADLVERVVHGPPIFAPLLFADLTLLGGLAVWDLARKGWFGEPGGAS